MVILQPACAIIIVTNNSEKHITKTMECINRQTLPPEKVIIVDTGSEDPSYLNCFKTQKGVEIIVAEKGIGFCKGNNIGMEHLPIRCDYVFFLNPDAFLSSGFIHQAITFMESPRNKQVGAISGTILGFDINKDKPTGMYDSTGIFRKWYGKWYDRDQRSPYSPGKYPSQESVPALCGAVMFCRKRALDQIRIRGKEIFDNRFYMYKEDIDLSLRLSEKGWKVAYVPNLVAYHCRGWNRNRKEMPKKMRLASARNELKIQWKTKSPIPILYSLLKLTAVTLFDL